MKYREIKNVCVIDSMYTLLQYLLLQNMEDIHKTFFFWSDGISEEVRFFFREQSKYIEIHRTKGEGKRDKNPILRKILLYLEPLLYYVYPIRWPFLRNSSIKYFGVDHLNYSKYIFGNQTFSLLEDGTLNYFKHNSFPIYSPKQQKILKMLYKKDFSLKTIYAGDEPNCRCVHLTGLLPLPSDYPQKVNIRSLESLWSICDESKRNYINQIYGLTEMSFDKLSKCSRILMTRPFSEDNLMTENEKVNIYKKIVEKLGTKGLLIKKHPRERTDYSLYFPNAIVMNQSIPMQLLTFNGIRFKEAYAIATTSIFDFPYHIKVGYIGSEIDSRIEKQMPNMRTDNISFEGKDVELLQIEY